MKKLLDEAKLFEGNIGGLDPDDKAAILRQQEIDKTTARDEEEFKRTGGYGGKSERDFVPGRDDEPSGPADERPKVLKVVSRHKLVGAKFRDNYTGHTYVVGTGYYQTHPSVNDGEPHMAYLLHPDYSTPGAGKAAFLKHPVTYDQLFKSKWLTRVG